MFRLLLSVIGFFLFLSYGYSQNDRFKEYQKRKQKEFDQYYSNRSKQFGRYKRKKQTEFDEYLEQRNCEFAAYLSERWVEYQSFRGVDPPTFPEPVKPVFKPLGGEKPVPEELPLKSVVPVPGPVPDAPLVKPDPDFSPMQHPQMSHCSTWDLGSYCIPLFEGMDSYRMQDASERSVSEMWSWLSADNRMDEVVESFLIYREWFSLNDYLFMRVVKHLMYEVVNSSNESVVVTMFILAQCGYDVKCANKNNELVLLIPFRETIYGMTYLTYGSDRKYYVIDNPEGDGSFYSFDKCFSPSSVSMSVSFKKMLSFDEAGVSDIEAKDFCSERFPQMCVSAEINRIIINALDHYPVVDWNIYANTPMSEELEQSVMPRLASLVSGTSETEAANMLINFVQTAFEYKTDEEQFGRERPLFVDETFHYPYSDCEDRAILYSYLVRHLLHLDVVLLHYSNHLATAVRFNELVSGDYVMVDGQKYIICDPTYIGADIGETMPQYRNSEVEVVKLTE